MALRYDVFNRNKYESHRLVYDRIEKDAKVLDVGCATGYFARELKKKNCEVWGIDSDKEALKKAKIYCQETHLIDLDQCKSLPVPKRYFDVILLLDVIEHMSHPERLVKILKSHLNKGGRIFFSTPNIAHASIRWMLAKGVFEYTDTGIMDYTHTHFYTKKTLTEFVKNANLKTEEIIPTNGMCKVPLLYKITDRLPEKWQYRIAKLAPELFSYQFIVIARVK